MSAYFKQKCRHMEKAMESLRAMGVVWQSPEGGLGLWCRLPYGTNDMKLYQALWKRNVLIFPGKLFYPQGTEEGCFMRLSFSNISDEKIDQGIAMIEDEIRKQNKNVDRRE